MTKTQGATSTSHMHTPRLTKEAARTCTAESSLSTQKENSFIPGLVGLRKKELNSDNLSRTLNTTPLNKEQTRLSTSRYLPNRPNYFQD